MMITMEGLIGRHLLEHTDDLASTIVQRHYLVDPSMPQRGGSDQPRRDAEQARRHLQQLAQAMLVDAPGLFEDYITWCRDVSAARGQGAHELGDHLRAADAVLRDLLNTAHYGVAQNYLSAGLAALARPPQAKLSHVESSPRRDLAGSYLQAMLAGERSRARDLILSAVGVNVPVAHLYLHVFQPVLREIGRLWQANRITTAQEHYVSSATQWVMSQLDPYLPRSSHRKRRFLCTCVGGETHAIGIRMVCDFLDMDGWETHYLGADTPTDSIVSEAIAHNASIVGISVTMLNHLDTVASLIRAVRREPQLAEVRILVGGRPFILAPQLHQRLGADATGVDAQQAVQNANALFENK